MLTLALIFLAGWFMGLLLEYGIHWALHYYKVPIHIDHHKDFFRLSPKEVATNSRCLSTDFRYAAYVLVALLPLVFFWGWVPVFTFFLGMLWQLVVIYESCHYALHYDAYVPSIIRRTRLFRWWRRCHLAHHYHVPRGNFSVSCPPIDWIMGTYVHPRDDYPDDPTSLVKRRRSPN